LVSSNLRGCDVTQVAYVPHNSN